MFAAGGYISYSISVFVIVFISGCAANLLKQHYIFQLAGIAFLFTFSIIRTVNLLQQNSELPFWRLYFDLLPLYAGISACLITMVLGFWIFPHIRRKFKD